MEKQYVKTFEIEPLDKRNDLYIVAMYDRLAKESSNLVFMKNLDLVDRFFKASLNNLDPFELDVYVLGIYNSETLQLTMIDKMLDLNELKTKIRREGAEKNATS